MKDYIGKQCYRLVSVRGSKKKVEVRFNPLTAEEELYKVVVAQKRFDRIDLKIQPVKGGEAIWTSLKNIKWA